MALTLRETQYQGVAGKGTALSHAEMDANFIALDTPYCMVLNFSAATKLHGGAAWGVVHGLDLIAEGSTIPEAQLNKSTGEITIDTDGMYEIGMRLRTNVANHKLCGYTHLRAPATVSNTFAMGTELSADQLAAEGRRMQFLKKGDKIAPTVWSNNEQDITIADDAANPGKKIDVDNYFIVRRIR